MVFAAEEHIDIPEMHSRLWYLKAGAGE
jgi:hypothetical protein